MTTIVNYASGRTLRVVLALTCLLILVSGRGSGVPGILQAQANPVVAENLLAGDTDWDVPGQGAGSASIQGFASDMSVNLGETIQFKIDTSSSNYRIDIYRLGYYNGAGARKVATIADADIIKINQPNCATDTSTGLVDCGNWGTNASWTVPASMVSGVYLARPADNVNGNASHIVFVVRDDSRTADILMQTSDTTWQAYNLYGGNSLYCGAPYSNAGTAYGCLARAVKVSYNRPFDTRNHDPQSFLFNAEYPMIRFLEANGYNVKYWSGVDTDRFGANTTMGLTSAKKPKIFLSVGHDEYWSGAQRTNVENARNAGVNLSFMSGNEVYWKTRWEPAISGSLAGHRTLVSYKETLAGSKIDPLPGVWTGTWRDTRFASTTDGGRPENALIGSIWTVNCCGSAITVPSSMAGLRLWRNTRVASLLPGETATLASGALGYEWGEALENGFQPDGLVRMSSTTLANQEKLIDFGSHVGPGTATHTLTLYKHQSGALVFGASTVQWAWGLDGDHDVNSGSPAPDGPDQAMQQATVNLFADMGAQPSSLQVGADPTRPLVTSAQTADIFAPTSTVTSPAHGGQVESGSRITVTGTATDAGGGAVGGVEVSVDGGATWRKALGTSNWTFDWIPGVVGTATIKTRATDDSGNLEIAGAGVTVAIVVGECPCPSLWKPSVVPGTASAADSGEYELGVKFKSDVDGYITGIRFYKGPSNNGTHAGNLWSSTGTLLASAVFTNESPTGWQQVDFNAPVAITANTIYVASYHTPNGGYAFDGAYFLNAGKDSPPLHALQNGVSGGNGVFSPGPMAFPTNSFNAANYWVDVVFAQSLEDQTAPAITQIKSTTLDSSRVTVTWATDEASNTRLDYSTNPSIQTASLSNLPAGTITVSQAAFATEHTVPLSGLQPNTTYYYLVSSTDAAGNTTTVAAPSFTVPGPTLRDTAATDFSAGTMSATYVSQTADGEVILQPTVGAEFSGPGLPEGWVAVNWNSQGSAVIVDGVLLVDGARVANCATPAACAAETLDSTAAANLFAGPRSLEFSANYSGDQFQHAGLGQTFSSTSEPWAIFSTLSGGMLFARTNTGNGAIDTPIGVAPLGEFHRYRIDWTPTSVTYYIDGALVATHNVAVAGPLRPVAASDFNPFGGIVFVDWMRLLPASTPGEFESRVFDANSLVNWKSIQWQADVPAGTSLQISVRTGNTAVPDGDWSAWLPIAGPGPLSLDSQFIQYRAQMNTSDPFVSPALHDVIISTGNAPTAVNDFVSVAKNGTHTFPPSGVGSLTFNDTDADANDTLHVVSVTTPSHGVAMVHFDGSVAYSPALNYDGPDAFTYTVSDGLLTSSATVTVDVRDGNIPPIANNDFFALAEDTMLIVPGSGVLGNDSDADNDPLNAVLMTLPLHGMLTFNAGGSFTYTPTLNYAGPDSFTYRANDGVDSGNIATVNLLVNQVNDPPFTMADSFTAVLNQPLDVPAPGVLANDRDVEVEDTAPLTAQLISGPSHGVLQLNSDGSFSYLPSADFLGTDSFVYASKDHFGAVSLSPKTVTLMVAIKAVSAVVSGGATVETGGPVSAGDPLRSQVTTPTPATVSIAQGVISGADSPTGYSFLNQQVNITVTGADGAELTASPSNPLVFVFEIDLSLVPAGQTHETFQVFRNDVLVPNCLGATSIPAANLDPCVSERSNSTGIRLKILTTHASHWNMGVDSASLGAEITALPDGPYLTNFQTPFTVAAPGVLTNDFGGTNLVADLVQTENGTVDLDPSGSFVFTPAIGHCGPASFSYRVFDGTSYSAPSTVVFMVNCKPNADPDQVIVLEDSGTTAIGVISNDEDPDSQAFTITAVTQGTNGTVLINPGGTFVTYQPVANYFGPDSFTYTITDTRGDSAVGTVTVEVTPKNDAPSFIKGANQTVLEDSAAQSLGWATALSIGPANEAGQSLSFTTSNNNASLFSIQPTVSSDGSLSYQPAADAFGTAIVTVSVQDTGGTLDGGVDTSAPQTFTITVAPVNDVPSFVKGANQSMLEDTGAQSIAGWATNMSAGPANESGQALSFVVTNDNAALFSTQPAVSSDGTMTYDPAPNAHGTATVSVSIKDNGGIADGGVDTSSPQTFTITVSLLNDAPSFTPGANQTVNEDAAAQSIAWATNLSAGPGDESGQTLAFVIDSNSNAALFSVAPAVSSTGTLTFTPAANANGTANIVLRLTDSGGTLNGGVETSAPHTLTITVNAVNDAPSFTKGADQSVVEDSGAQSVAWATAISAGPANESAQTVSFTVSNDNAALFSVAPQLSASGTLSYTPAPNAHGTATVSVSISDNGGIADGGVDTSSAQTFTITVSQLNDAPSFTPGANQTVNEDAAAQSIAWATNLSAGPGDESGQTLAFVIDSNSNAALFSVAPAVSSTGTLTFTPAANANGTANIVLRLTDSGGTLNGGVETSAPHTLTITVNAVNDAPSFTKGADQTVVVNSGMTTVANWATARSAGPANEAGQALTFAATNTNNALFSAQPAVAPNGTLTFTPASGLTGSAVVTVTLTDDGGTANGGVNTSLSQTFTINVVRGTTATAVASSNSNALSGTGVTFTATVTSLPAGNLIGGTVTFSRGATPMGTGVIDAAGQARFTTTTLAVGTHSITAAFAGNVAYSGSTSPAISQVISPSAKLTVNFTMHSLLDNSSRPKVRQTPVEGALVRVYRRWEACTGAQYVSVQPKKWAVVFDGLDGLGPQPGCPVVTFGTYSAEGTTDANGNVTIIVPPTTTHPNIDYLIVGRSEDTTTPIANDVVYAAHLISTVQAGQTKKAPLHVIKMFDLKRLAAWLLEEFGSYLAMVQPEEMEFTDDQKLYPVILVAEGAWDVTTSVATPSGFVPEETMMSTPVADAVEAMQFTINDIGSEWTPTTVTHVIKHNGETRVQSLAVPMLNNKATRAKIDYFTVEPGSSANVLDVLVNDNVAPPKTLTITSVVPGQGGGSVTVSADRKTVLYTPPYPQFVGVDMFQYFIVDSEGAESSVWANVRINSKPSIVIDDISVAEGHQGSATALFTVTLSNPSENEISFDYATVDGTAVAGKDFSLSSGTATFAPGETTKKVAVQIIGNTAFELSRQFTMKIWLDAANKTNAVVLGGGATGVIVDDDPKPVLSSADVSVIEGDSGTALAFVNVTLANETALPASFKYTTANGSATAGSGDYVTASGTLTFAPGETSKTFELSINGDTTSEPIETFSVNFSNVVNAESTAPVKVTIIDDDSTSWLSTTVAHFDAGTIDAGAYITKTANGEITLMPALVQDFLGSEVPEGWTSTPTGAGGTTTVATKWASINGASLVEGTDGYGPGRSLEFQAIYTGAAGQWGGFSGSGAASSPFSAIGTRVSNSASLVARTVSGTTVIETPIVGNYFNAIVTARVEWNATNIVFYVNNKKVATHNVGISAPMRPTMIDSVVGGGLLAVGSVRLTPYAAEGNYTSPVFDAGGVVTWVSSSWTATIPAGTAVVIQYRTGNTPTPDDSWTSFTTVSTSGGALTGASRYVQFTARETTSDSKVTPMLKDVTLQFVR